jgi:hypothetical protein
MFGRLGTSAVLRLSGGNTIRGVSKKFGEWSDISKATWARCARMHMAIQRYIVKCHLEYSTRDLQGKLAAGSRT